MKYITLELNNFLNNSFRKKTNIILGNYIKNYISTQIFIEIKWPIDLRKDPIKLFGIQFFWLEKSR